MTLLELLGQLLFWVRLIDAGGIACATRPTRAGHIQSAFVYRPH
jgi:hypothetical protein